MKTARSISELYEQLKLRFLPFSVVFFSVVFVTYLVLYVLDIYPEPVSPDTEAEAAVTTESTIRASAEPAADTAIATNTPVAATVETARTAAATSDTSVSASTDATVPDLAALPVQLHFDVLDRTVPVLNPESPAYAALDQALQAGAVRHPHSADLQDTGNMLILGHSSYLPNVLNRSFQAFNGVERLTWGDTVRLTSADTEYVYRVDRVYEALASEIIVPIGEERTPKLTLVTCDVLGAEEDRFIVEASLVETIALDT